MSATTAHASWRIIGLDCPDCARSVVAAVERLPGVGAADLNFASATLVVEYDVASDPRAAVVGVVQGAGHGVTPLEGAEDTPIAQCSWLDRNLADVATVGSGAFTVIGGAIALFHGPEPLAVAGYAVAVVFGGLLVWRRAWTSLKARILDMNVLMTVAVVGAALLGDWGEAATVYFLFALGGLLESRALERTRRSIRDLMDLAPPTARVTRGADVTAVPVATVAVGERVLVRPGERIPLDGRIVAGATAIDESPVTGESVPADKSEGDSVFAGTLNTTGLIEFEVTATAEDSTLSRIVFLVEEAQASRATSQQLVDKFSRVYTPAVIGLAVAVAIVPPAIQALLGVDGVAWVDWIQRALVLLVVSCPCALVISTPVSIVSAITRASRDGVLVKGGTHLETGARVRSIAFDKTGTLTQGLPEVVMVEPLGIGRDELLAIAASLEQGSAHPIARAVTRAGEARLGTKNVTEEPGRGVRGWIDGVEVAVESAQAAAADGLVSPAAQGLVDRFEREGATALVVSRAGVAIGVLGVADKVRDESSRVVATLLRQGLEHAVMLTGDNERVAQAVATATGVDEHVANLLPADKTAAIERLRATHGVVAMVGDGVNDAPALALADLGIAMGAAGSDTALETADVALMRDDLDALPGFFALCRRTVRTIKTNVAFSIAVKAVFVVLAVAGHATLWMAVFADTGVALLVIINGMRLLRPVTT